MDKFKYDILLVEDNQDDILLTKLGLKEAGLNADLTILNNGKLAIQYLQCILKDEKQLPDLILLDINLPVMNGFEALNEIKSIKEMNDIPVVIFTSSDSQTDMRYGYESGADLYIRKPNNLGGFKRSMLQAIQLVKEKDFKM